MRINTKIVWQMNVDGTFTELGRESYEYEGPVACAFGGRSTTTGPTTTQEIETTTIGLEDIEGIGIGAGRDVEFTQNITDAGAIQGAIGVAEKSFDFAGEFGSEAFDFASDIAQQAGQTSQQAIEVSRQAIGVVGTGGQSEISGQLFKFGGFAVAALAAIFILPRVFGRA
jgi:hypothetical protein